MKKIYIRPELTVLQLHCGQMLSTSGIVGVTNDNLGGIDVILDFGGADVNGLLNPEAKETTIFGDEEW